MKIIAEPALPPDGFRFSLRALFDVTFVAAVNFAIYRFDAVFGMVSMMITGGLVLFAIDCKSSDDRRETDSDGPRL